MKEIKEIKAEQYFFFSTFMCWTITILLVVSVLAEIYELKKVLIERKHESTTIVEYDSLFYFEGTPVTDTINWHNVTLTQ